MSEKKGFSTRALHSDTISQKWPGNPVICGISLSTTFKQESPGKFESYEYSRSGNPTRDALEHNIATIESAKHGLTFSSGLAAESAVLHLLKSGDEIISIDDVYGGTNRLLSKVFDSFNLKTKMVDMTDIQKLSKAITDKTKIIWVETPTNPTLKIVDIKAVRTLVDSLKREIIILVDNTFFSPYFQQPISLGADISLNSVTKYINGHSDVVMGSLSTNDSKIYEKLKFYQNAIGSIPSPFDCYLVLRGIKTLAVRMERHQANALKIAKHFEKHPKIEKLIYPGLPSHPQHEICKKQASGFSGIIAMVLKGNLDTTKKFLESLKIFSIAESLGGFESLAEHPAIMTHASVPIEQRKILGISDTLIRLSVGLEDAEDLITDLESAFDAS